MTDTECIHGLEPAWCALCKPPAPAPPKVTLGDLYDTGTYTVESTYDLVDPDGEYTGLFVDKLHIGGRIVWAAHGSPGRPKLYRTLKAAKAALITKAWTS